MTYNIIKIIIGLFLIWYGVKEVKNKWNKFVLWIFAIDLILPIKVGKGFYSISPLCFFWANPVSFITLMAIFYEMIKKLYINIRNKFYIIKNLDDLHREINFDYNPSIAGYLLKQNVEIKDLAADILYLYSRNILNIVKKGYKYNVDYGKEYERHKNELNSSDKYIIEKLLEKSSEFSFLEWESLIKNEYEVLKLSKTKKYMTDKTFFITNIALVIVVSALFWKIVVGPLLGFFIAFLFTLSCLDGDNKDSKLNMRGKSELKKCIRLKKFMEEYTLLQERTVEEVCIYESYIPYAVALNVNKEYIGTIFDIFGERNLGIILHDIDGIMF